MANYTMFRSQRMLLAGFLAGGVLFCSAQTTTAPSATKTAPKKAAPAGAAKTAAGAKAMLPGADNTEGQSELRDRRGSGQQAQNGTD